MEMKDDFKVKGAEGVVIHNGNIVLGMQKPKRWYKLDNGETATIIKTLGGAVEKEDNNSSRKALIREILEEVKGIERNNIRISKSPIFSKTMRMGDINLYEKRSNLNMNADFYLIEIINKETILPNDLPALIEIPLEKFLKLDFFKQESLNNIQEYITMNKNHDINLPENYSFMIPRDVKTFFERIIGDVER